MVEQAGRWGTSSLPWLLFIFERISARIPERNDLVCKGGIARKQGFTAARVRVIDTDHVSALGHRYDPISV
jgi:hypothetical protein